MFSLLKSFGALFSISPQPEHDRDARYLADSADIYDLERRMRQVDSGRNNLYSIGASGIFTR